MAFVNVKRDVTDQFYRYKMPLLIAKVGPTPLAWQLWGVCVCV